MKKLIAALTALTMFICCLPAMAGAREAVYITPIGGSSVSMQPMASYETNFGYALRGADLRATPNGYTVATATADDLLYFTGVSANDMATGKMWIEVNIVSTSIKGYMLLDDITFMTNAEYQAYLQMANPQPTPSPTPIPAPTYAPLPTPTPPLIERITPAPTYYPVYPSDSPIAQAVVTTNGGGLNLRMWASYSAQVLLTIPRNATVSVYEYSGSWARVRYAGVEGWVVRSYLRSGYTPAPTYQPTQPQGYAYVRTNGGGLNLRSYADSSAKVLLVIPRYARLEVLSYGASWSYVRYAGVVGYVVSSFLSFDSPGVTPTASPTYNPYSGYAVVSTESGGLNMRASAYVGAQILTVIPRGATVNVLSRGATWSYVTYRSYTGYVMTGFLSFTGQSASVVSTRALITASGAGLNMRRYASSSAGVIAVIPTMTEVAVLQRGERWTQISYGGRSGYVMTAYLTFLPQ